MGLGKTEDAKSLNTYLDTLQGRVYEAQRQLIANNAAVTAYTLKLQLEGGPKEKARMLIEVFDNRNSQMAQLVGKDCAEATLWRYLTTRNHTVGFLQWKFKTSDIDIRDLTYEFVTEFEFWLKSVTGCAHNTSMKYITYMRKIVNICLRNGWLDRDPFVGYKMIAWRII